MAELRDEGELVREVDCPCCQGKIRFYTESVWHEGDDQCKFHDFEKRNNG